MRVILFNDITESFDNFVSNYNYERLYSRRDKMRYLIFESLLERATLDTTLLTKEFFSACNFKLSD